MAPSQMEQQEQQQTLGQGYTHKKFNCSYSHKKLGMRFRQREDNNKENVQLKTTHSTVTTSKKQTLFRPYALGTDTPRRRKLSRSSDSSDDENSQTQFATTTETPISTRVATPTATPVATPIATPVPAPMTASYQIPTPQSPVVMASPTSSQFCSSPALSPNSYAERLQRQRAALYMRYMQQFHAGNMALPQATPVTYHYPMGYPNVTAPIYNGC